LAKDFSMLGLGLATVACGAALQTSDQIVVQIAHVQVSGHRFAVAMRSLISMISNRFSYVKRVFWPRGLSRREPANTEFESLIPQDAKEAQSAMVVVPNAQTRPFIARPSWQCAERAASRPSSGSYSVAQDPAEAGSLDGRSPYRTS
jgi:hypothetical protein